MLGSIIAAGQKLVAFRVLELCFVSQGKTAALPGHNGDSQDVEDRLVQKNTRLATIALNVTRFR